MNLIEAQRNLQGVPDEALINEMRQPSGIAPQYLVLSELQRRKALRAEASAQAPKSTVRQDIVGFAEGGQVENKPGWMSGGLGDFLNSGVLGFGLPVLNDIADGEGLFGIGLQPWILKQLGFGNKGEQSGPVTGPVGIPANAPLMRGFQQGGPVDAIEKVRRSESGSQKYNANNIVRDKNGKIISQAVGRDQFTITTWNENAKKLGLKPLKYGVKPGDAEWPSQEAQDKMGAYHQNSITKALDISGWDSDDPVARKVTTMFGNSGGPKLLDIITNNPNMSAADALKDAMGLKEALKAIRANNINPEEPIFDAIDRFTSKVGGSLPSGEFYRPSREEYMADLQRAAMSQDPDHMALIEEEMNSVPEESAWSGAAQQEQMMQPGQAMIGPRITGGGIDQLMPQLTSPTRRPGEGPAPWQVIAGPQAFGGRFKAQKFAGGGGVKVKDGIEYRENEAGNYVDAQGRPYPEDWNGLTMGVDAARYGVGAATDIVGGALQGIGNAANWMTLPTGQRPPLFGRPAAPPPPQARPGVPAPKPVDQEALLKGFRGMMSTPETVAAEAVATATAEPERSFDTMEQYLSTRAKLKEPSYDVGIASAPRNEERDKWLALTEFGSRLAAGTSPYFAQNFGPATAAGIASYRQSQAQYDDDMSKRANQRLQQAQLNELARSRADNTAAKLTEISGSVESARLRSLAQLQRISTAMKFGQSIDPQTYASRLRDYKDLIMADPVLTYEQKMIEMKKAEAMVFNDLQSKGIYKAQKGLGAIQDDGRAFDGDVAD